MYPLINILKDSETSEIMMEKVLLYFFFVFGLLFNLNFINDDSDLVFDYRKCCNAGLEFTISNLRP